MQKILRFDSVGGASGDMILGVLLGLGSDREELQHALSSMLGDEFDISFGPFSDCGIAGVRAKVELHDEHCGHHRHHDHDSHDHNSWREIKKLIEQSDLPDEVKTLSVKTFALLAAAEGRIHGKEPDEVVFHEVGAVDSIVDIVGCNYLYWKNGFDGISVSSLPTGSGVLKCAHGIYPVPAPATLEILRVAALKTYPCEEEKSELLTPTGAALLASWANAELPEDGRVTCVVNSFGQRKLSTRPNLLRGSVYVSESGADEKVEDRVLKIEFNLDDASPELIGALADDLRKSGALELWQTPVFMKKDRAAVMISLLVMEKDKEALLEKIFRSGLTLGVRLETVRRETLEREIVEEVTPYGVIRFKYGFYQGETVFAKPEYEDCRRLAAENGISLKELLDNLKNKQTNR